MNSAQFSVVSAILDQLRIGPALADGRIYRSRTRAIGVDQASAIVVRVERSTSTLAQVIGGPTTWATLVNVECYARATGSEPDAVTDALVVNVFDRLALAPTLGGAAMSFEPLPGDTLSWEVDELDSKIACITAKFLVMHQTKGRTLT
ncbi:hypothetical protein V3C40_01080 [Janthinobacterium sp. LS2A]|uniref:hypothetical protein n=1 Tax=Janthinobacterium sp. LS2A TaxID=3118590 RepID=UPI002F9217D0